MSTVMNKKVLVAVLATLIGVTVGTATAFAKGDSVAGIDLNRFSALYNRSRTLEESVQRLEKMEDLRRTAQESLERLMKEKGSNVELELRYGELIVQRGRDLEQFSLEVGVAGDMKRSKTLRDRAHDLLKKGLKLHRSLLARVKHHPMAAKVYLGMARTEYGLGMKSASLNDADNGIRVAKASNGDDTLLQLHLIKADAAFDMAKAAISLEAYTKAQKLAARGSLEESYIEYKLAWVYYNLKDAETALAHLDRLFSISGDRFALRQEAVQDFALFAADLGKGGIEKRGGFKGIYSYLQQKSDNKIASKAIERLANTLSKNGRRAEGVSALEFLIGEDSFGADSVDYALTIVEWSQNIADKKALTDRYFWLINQFGPKSAWFAAQSNRAEIQRNSQEKIEESVRKYALELHRQSTKENVEELRRKREDVVARLYDAHIANFSRTDDIPRAQSARIHYYRAEIHRRRNEWKEAGLRYDSYLRMVELVPKDQLDKIDVKLKDEAIWGAVQVWAKAIDKDKTLVPQMLTACDRFLKENEKDPRAPQVLLDAAKVELKSSNPSIAIARLERLVEKYPKTPQSVEGVHAHLDILNKENDWVNLAITARKRMDKLDTWAPAKDKPKLHAELYKILSQTEAKACEALSSEKDRKLEAALCFEHFAKGFEKDEQAPKALLRAADLYDGLKDASAAVSALELLVKHYPKSEYAAQGFSRLATVYEKAFEFEKAVNIYETLLEKNPKLPEREKVVERMLILLSGLGYESKFNTWLARKDTPEKLRRDFLARKAEQDLVNFRMRESIAGYTGRGPASVEGRDFFGELEAGHKAGRLTLEQELEYRRIRGKMYFADKKLDKADEEWLAGLKQFWRAKDRSPSAWEAAARIRLEEAGIWETAYRNTDVMKNPTRKAELYKKLEGWYAEVIQMKAPVIALEALWKSAELNTRFADELRQAPTPPELLAKGMEGQRKAYEKLILERTEPMKKQALQIIEQIAIKAREWKVVSPVVLSSLKIVSNLRSGVELPGTVVRVNEDQVLNFPWSDLPRWMDLTAEQKSWEEWKLTDLELTKIVKDLKKRSAARRAAFVLLSRHNTLSDKEVSGWAKTLTDKAGIQLRIQAMIDDRDLDRASLFLEQYESFFGADAFSEHHWGRLEWARRNYASAYLRWVRPVVQASGSDFRSVYWTEGWGALLSEIIEGQNRSSDIFNRLAPLAKEDWQKQYIAKLCVDNSTECRGEFSDKKLINVLTEMNEGPLAFRFADGRSVWQVHRESLIKYISSGVARAKRLDEIENLRKALASLYQLHNFTEDAKDFLVDYWSLRHKVDFKQDQLDNESKQKIIVGVAHE